MKQRIICSCRVVLGNMKESHLVDVPVVDALSMFVLGRVEDSIRRLKYAAVHRYRDLRHTALRTFSRDLLCCDRITTALLLI